MTDDETRRAVAAVFRIESAKLIAGLARMVRDVGLAEELAQDALVAALEHWPSEGVADKPGAWLMATAKRRGIDRLRRARLSERKHDALAHDLADHGSPNDALDDALDDPVGDDLLRLVFVACHPVLSPEARVALTLRLLGGLTTAEIARAFLVPEATIAQRVVRAKKALADAAVAFEVPRGAELGARLSSVLEVVYLIFNEGYSATAGDDWMRPALCEDALRLGRILAGLAPDEPEVHACLSGCHPRLSVGKCRRTCAGRRTASERSPRVTAARLRPHRGTRTHTPPAGGATPTPATARAPRVAGRRALAAWRAPALARRRLPGATSAMRGAL